MQINVTFSSLEEMKEFIDKVYLTADVPKKTVSIQQPVPASAQPPIHVQAPVQQSVQVPVQAQVQQVTPLVTQAPVQQPAQITPVHAFVQQPVQTSDPAYELDDLARAAMTLMDAGRQGELQGLLKAFGVEALPALPREQYGAFATALREKGAQI